MPDIRKPRRGSMAVRPRKRAQSQVTGVFWKNSSDKRVLGFAGYKAGMMHIAHTDDTESPTKGQEVVSAATVLEVPPMVVYGVRCYGQSSNSVGDILTSDKKLLEEINIKKSESKPPQENDVSDVRLLAYAQPHKTSIGKKHAERMEIGIGGKDVNEKLEYAKSLVGKELKASEVFKPGEFIDVIAVTKGKGWQGAIKRFGVAKQRRKATNKVRHVGTLGQWHPAYVLYTIPQAGQTGYHQRTELNKQIMRVGSDIDGINPNSGFLHYGFVKSDYLVLKGSIPGPCKRLIRLRLSIRAGNQTKEPKVSYLSTKGS